MLSVFFSDKESKEVLATSGLPQRHVYLSSSADILGWNNKEANGPAKAPRNRGFASTSHASDAGCPAM